MRVHPARLLALALLSACSDSVAPATVDVRVITTDSRDPFEAAPITRVTLEIAQEGAEPVRVVEDVDDDFDLGLVLRTLVDRTRTRVVLEGPDGVLLHGASPPFVPIASGGLVRILVGAPGTCERVPRAMLPTARIGRGHAVADTFAILLAGLDADGAASRGVTSIDLLRFDTVDDQTSSLPALVGAGGRARAASFGTSRLAVVSELGAVVYDLAVFEGRETPLTLHDGADPTSAIGSVDTAAVIAGGSGDAAATWLTVERRLIPIELVVARQHAALADVGGVALVAGGLVGDPPGELLRPSSPTSVAVEGPDDGVRRSPMLLVDGNRALLVGGLDADGALRTDTVLFEGCPDACRASAGPGWTSARPGVVATGPFLVGGDRVERWTDEGLVEHTRLATPRRDALVTRLESDLLVVAGGENDEGPLREVELCFPTTLPPL